MDYARRDFLDIQVHLEYKGRQEMMVTMVGQACPGFLDNLDFQVMV